MRDHVRWRETVRRKRVGMWCGSRVCGLTTGDADALMDDADWRVMGVPCGRECGETLEIVCQCGVRAVHVRDCGGRCAEFFVRVAVP